MQNKLKNLEICKISFHIIFTAAFVIRIYALYSKCPIVYYAQNLCKRVNLRALVSG